MLDADEILMIVFDDDLRKDKKQWTLPIPSQTSRL